VAYIDHTTRLEKAETSGATFIACFQGTNLRRTEIVSRALASRGAQTHLQNCVTWMAQILCGNALLNYAVVFLQNAGWSQDQTFNINIALRSCYVIGGIISWFLMVRVGRADLYIGGLAFMFACLLAIDGLGFAHSNSATLAVGIVLVIQTLCNMITVGPVCYPLVSETPSGRLRYKTIVIGRFVYQLTQIFNNSVTPRMVSSTCKSGPAYNVPSPD
jgi:SP family general alpha glucoside:H+ symporter-like MFS transporter